MTKVVITALAVAMLFGGHSFSEGIGGDLLLNGMDARAQGMGNAVVSITDDVNAIYWNPSGLPYAKKFEASSMYSNLYNFNIHYATLGVASGNIGIETLRGHAIGLGIIYLGIDDIPVVKSIDLSTGEPRIETETMKDREFALLFSYGYAVLKNLPIGDVETDLSVGLTGKYFGQTLYTNSAWGFSSDAGIRIRIFPYTTHVPGKKKSADWGEVNAGFIVLNVLHSKIVWDTPSKNEDNFPIIYKPGISYKYNFPWATGSRKDNVIVSVEPELQYNRPLSIRFGAETWLSRQISSSSIFFGIRSGFESNNFTAGASAGFLNDNSVNPDLRYEIQLDYAFVLSPINHAHRFSLAWKLL